MEQTVYINQTMRMVEGNQQRQVMAEKYGGDS